ncbi:hypothetical protein [Archangium lansingense]|uniref:Uncharacterized protein n=1 Tax=Archangium lansingense TaxID=2995310 RepID=A0ABT4AQ14_9BACT|nr:hypothetical protein [Archangium lansinium]MCY1083787.1 hypothetical protein [Archangium lansinium]
MTLGDCEHLSWLKGLKVGDRVRVRPLPNGQFTFETYVTAVVRGGVAVNWELAAGYWQDKVRLFSTRTGKEKDVGTKRHYIMKP